MASRGGTEHTEKNVKILFCPPFVSLCLREKISSLATQAENVLDKSGIWEKEEYRMASHGGTEHTDDMPGFPFVSLRLREKISPLAA
jgi:hypothetical protein